jgi:hypothetical protein
LSGFPLLLQLDTLVNDFDLLAEAGAFFANPDTLRAGRFSLIAL